uniref:Uncharacterized protein n=1 Tax=Arundo donax TaxID=35708 RepID=A0A0A9GA01_ARUDO
MPCLHCNESAQKFFKYLCHVCIVMRVLKSFSNIYAMFAL